MLKEGGGWLGEGTYQDCWFETNKKRGNTLSRKKSMKRKYAETKRLIRQAMREKRLVLFVGAGASKNSGMPLWNEAINEFVDKFDFDGVDSKKLDNTIIPQYYYNERGRKEYAQLSREIFRYEDKLKTTAIHKKILKFNVDTIITTNYDHLIEQAGGDNGVFFQVVSQNADLPYRRGGKELIKMHGDFEHHNFVLKENDYLHYSEKFKLIENYIKSLIGTKLVLFIGYSLNDPDVKHIFSWTKDILRGHFQRAYLIVTGKRRNHIEENYYRNLGVNIIYATELLNGAVNFNDHKEQLLQTLDYFLKDEKPIIDFLYYNLKPLADLNYVYYRYIEQVFARLRSTSQRFTLEVYKSLLCSNSYPLNEELIFLNELSKAINGKNVDPKINTIVNVLIKGNVKGITHYIGKQKVVEYFSIPHVNENLDWINDIIYFDYNSLRKHENDLLVAGDEPEIYLKQAYISVFLSDYKKAYIYLDIAIKHFYRNHDYVWYFIALWNKYNVARIILMDCHYNNDIDEDTLNEIRESYEGINLEQTLQSIPDFGNFDYQFLEDLKGFKFAAELFYNTTSNSREVSEQANASFVGGVPAFSELRQQVFDYYKYGISNYLIVDRYFENNEIFLLFARSMFESVSASDKNLPSYLENVASKNRFLNALDVHMILRYVQVFELRKLFADFNIDLISLSELAIDYLKIVAKNLSDIRETELYERKDVFWRYLCFVSHTKIDEELANLLINALIKLPETEYLEWPLSKNVLARKGPLLDFVYAFSRQKLYSNGDLCKSMMKFTLILLNIVISHHTLLPDYAYLIINLIDFMSKGNISFDDVNVIKGLLSIKYTCHFLIYYYQLVAFLYDKGNDGVKKIIKDDFKEWECPKTFDGYHIYSELVLADIIEPDNKIESEALKYMKDKPEGEPKAEQVIPDFVNLYLENKIIDKGDFESIVKAVNNPVAKWLIDVENYDYADFDLSWLKNCNDSFCEKLAKNTQVKEKIFSKYKEERQSGTNDKQIDEIILKYFI